MYVRLLLVYIELHCTTCTCAVVIRVYGVYIELADR